MSQLVKTIRYPFGSGFIEVARERNGMIPSVSAKGSWYFEDIYICPQCKAELTIKRRVLPPKPDDYRERFRIIEKHCGCNQIWQFAHSTNTASSGTNFYLYPSSTGGT